MDSFGPGAEAPPTHLVPCPVCGRNFNENAVQRHIPICQKQANKTRKVFDSSKMRAEGTDIKTVKPSRGSKMTNTRSPAAAAAAAAPQNNWRAKHQDFQNAMKAAKGLKHAQETGGPLPPPPPPSINPDYIDCPYCTRRFNETAAQRHIDFCKGQAARLPTNKVISATAQQRAAARSQYKAPKLKKKEDEAGPSYSGHGAGGYGPSSRAAPSTTTRPSPNQRTTGRGGPGGYANTSNNSSGYKTENGGSGGGRSLRTGRTQENYDDGRSLSAKQRMQHAQYNSPRGVNGTGFSSGGSSGGGGRGGARHQDPGYHSGDSDYARNTSATKFCHECGSKYPIPTAKYCCECGIRRM